MENWIKQICMRIFHVEEENNAQTSRVIRDRKVSSRRTRSFKGDSRKSQDWGRRKPSHEKSRNDEKMETVEFRTAVAAAAFAINSIENKEQEIKQDPNLSSNSRKTLSEIMEMTPQPKTNDDLPSGANQRKLAAIDSKTDEKVPVKTTGSTSSIEKTPTIASKKQSEVEANQKEPESKLGKPNTLEKIQLEKTRERYMKVNARIFEWENKKKSKAKMQLIRKEGKLEWKRARALQDFKKKMQTVENISRGAISKNEENRKREEARVKQKANMIRSTGQVHKPMFLCW
ncbi:uncharacterized protein LOC143563638 [Bidens hawaiensis]|uniref:uncharacterized protein LOC143563638 n=1 Tax=Bidens hawaiensis TaxID=980011 RepID=UPI00404AC0D4